MRIPKSVFLILAAATLAAQQPAPRFDYVVREDYFAGLAGDQTRLGRAMTVTETILANNPEHAEALVWHGLGLILRSRDAFQQGNAEAGTKLFQDGSAEMARAVALEPDNLGVRIPRGAALREYSKYLPPEMAPQILELARADLQHAYELQEPTLDRVPKPHPLGELLQGLGDIYSRQGKPDVAERYYRQSIEMLEGTEYASRARLWLNTRQPLSMEQSACIGCHTGN